MTLNGGGERGGDIPCVIVCSCQIVTERSDNRLHICLMAEWRFLRPVPQTVSLPGGSSSQVDSFVLH